MDLTIQPPPSSLQGILGSAYKWLVDTINKIQNIGTQATAALEVVGLTLRNNQPDGNDITWGAFTIWYQGVPYAIAAGNTTGGALFAYWNVGDAALTVANSFTPSPTTFPILTNVAGTADTTWDKVGASSIQTSQVIGGLLPPGYQVQTPATVSYSGGPNVLTLINFSGTGALLSVGFAWNVSTAAGGVVLSINVDGTGAQTYQITTPNNPSPDPITQAWGLSSSAAAAVGGNPGYVSFFQLPFKTSLVVQMTVNSYVSGSILAAAGWAKKTAA
jgi:hypothetical protein